MRRPVALLVAVFLACGAAAALAACGNTATPDRPTGVPTATDTVPMKASAVPTATATLPAKATASPSVAADSAPAFTPTPAADVGLEFAPPDSSGTSGKDEGITISDQDRSQKGGESNAPVQGRSYTWEDGDRTLAAYLQTDLVVDDGSDDSPRDVVAANAGGGNIVKGTGGRSDGGTLPVFRSESGTLMTLPGGVLLVLDPEWSAAQVSSFFSSNGIKLNRVSELSYAPNGFFVETEPGFPSLELANTLAAQDGVELSSPNWWRESVKK